ncbi:MAG: DNA replication/repair protein RecF [Gammaproteobacteria bacterium]
MSLRTLLVKNLRIIEHLELSLAEDATLFCGENGAGKTSILEAIDFLSRGRTFRSRRLEPLLRAESKAITVSGEVFEDQLSTHLGIQKSIDKTVLHCNQQKVDSISNHANYLPVVCLHPDCHQLIQGGARYRRNYIDWSAFHVKQEFLSDWRNYSKCLRQRNQVLRQDNIMEQELSAWTTELSEAGEKIDYTRSQIFNEISPIFEDYSRKLLPECEITWVYDRGWSKEQSLQEALEQVTTQERRHKTTRRGPQRAEIKILMNKQDAAMSASRGQQKQIAACLMLAQIAHVQHANGRNCVVLLDDIRAELDQVHADALFASLQALNSQVIASAIEPKQVSLEGWTHTKLFHVKQGTCELMA